MVIELARSTLDVLDQATGGVVAFEPTDEQQTLVDALCRHQRVVALKSRQQGISTAVLLYIVAFAIINPGVPIAIVADTEDTAKGLLKRLRSFFAQVGVPLTVDSVTQLVLANGVTIDARTSGSRATDGESRTGRSRSYGLIMCTEMAFWVNDAATYSALSSTALSDCVIIVESTAHAADNLFRATWERGEGWHHVFFSVEAHAEYQRDPAEVDDELWASMQADYGFTSRPHAAWWWRKLVVDFDRNVRRMLREYPVLPVHPFQAAEGRWVLDFVDGTPRIDGAWSIYDIAAEQQRRPVIIGVDTAIGTGLDSSAIGIVDWLTGALVATWKSNTVEIPDYIEIVREAKRRWKVKATVVEKNGCGAAVFSALRYDEGGAFEYNSSNKNGEKEIRLNLVKNAFEDRTFVAGPDLRDECLKSVRDKLGKYTGPDDLISALSFALHWRKENMPPQPPAARPDFSRTFVAAREAMMRGTKRRAPV